MANMPHCCTLLRQMSDGNIESHIFSRVVNPANTENVDINAVNALLNERVLAREGKDFRRADNLLNELLTQHGVILNDSDKTWRIGTKKEVKKRIALSKPKMKAAASTHNVQRKNYLLSPNSGPNVSTLSENEIVTMLGDRRSAQRVRDYAKADSIRDSLKSDGVYVEDGLKEFRYDGIPFDTRRGKIRESKQSWSSSPIRSWMLFQSKHSLALDNTEMELVNDLLAQRSNARSSGNYAVSDSIRDQIFETHNIRIDDQLGEWSVGGKFFGDEEDNSSHWASTKNKQTLLGYKKSEASQYLPESEERYIQGKVDERMRAKRTRNYELSDSIRDELYSNYDVTIHDKMNLWSAGGDFGEGNSWNHVVPDKSNHTGHRSNYGRISISNDDASREVDAHTPQEEITGNSLAREELESLTVVQLKEKLRESRLAVSGTKAKLINRLLGV